MDKTTPIELIEALDRDDDEPELGPGDPITVAPKDPDPRQPGQKVIVPRPVTTLSEARKLANALTKSIHIPSDWVRGKVTIEPGTDVFCLFRFQEDLVALLMDPAVTEGPVTTAVLLNEALPADTHCALFLLPRSRFTEAEPIGFPNILVPGGDNW